MVGVRRMKLDLSEIAATVGKKYRYEIKEECAEDEDLRCIAPIVGSIEFTNTGRLIVARGSVSTTIELDCSRCLERLTAPVEVETDEQFPVTNVQALMAGYEEEITEEEQEPLFVNNILDLPEFIRQMILVQVPIQPLCSKDCKGLCPTCGRNLNEGPCDCPLVVEVSPFAALGQFLGREKRSNE